MRDREFWERWLRRNGDEFRPRIGSIRDWYRAAGVEKGERRDFKAALKGLGMEARGGKGGKFSRHRPAGSRAESARGEGRRRPRAGEDGPHVEGRLRFTRDGKAIVVADFPDVPAVRIPGGALSDALPKDRVVARLERRKGGAPLRGRIVRIVERGIREFVGRYAPVGARPFVRFRDREADLLIPVAAAGTPPPDPGDLVLAEISEYPSAGREGRAAIIRALGKEHTMETIALAVTAARGIPSAFSEGALREASRVPEAVRIPPGGPEAGGPARVDQRDLPYVTIDGEDARDFDDAVCLVRDRDRTRLYVAIADVSHYVPVGGDVDRDAYDRGTSVYFPDRCIPMLPPRYSEGVCSLKPGVNRLAMTVEIPLNAQGRPGAASFYPSVIRSRARLTYDRVHGFLSGPEGQEGRWGIPGGIGPMLREMETVAGRLALARADRGSLDFELPEAAIEVADNRPVAVSAAPRWEAHRLIEEFMLLANTAVAEFLSDRGLPFLFRIHEEPAGKRVAEFEEAAARLLRRSRVTDRRDAAGRLQAWAAAARGSRYERHLNMLLLRSLMLARYGPEAKGHFGLALARYTHFTSPIRRYPDLIVHRVLRAALGDARLGAYPRTLAETAAEVGGHLSARERAAMEAERDVEQRAKALFMGAKVGQTFSGIVSSVVGFGFFVELDDFLVEGLVHVSTLRDDVYRFDAERGEWRGVVRKTRFALGERVRVRVRRADADRGEVDLLFVEKIPESS
ncbi:MAG: ribonuclease R [Gemmatimonadota bacterium]